MEKVCKAKNSKDEGKATVVEEANEAEEVLLMAQIDAKSVAANTWLIDSGCSNNLTSNESLFSELDKSFKVRVKIGKVVFYLKHLVLGQ